MNILAINSGIGASVCLLQNGQIVLAVEEERLCREKGYMGFPLLSLRYLKTHFPEIMRNLDAVGLAGTEDNLFSKSTFLKKYADRVRRDKDKTFKDLYLRPIRHNAGKLVPTQFKSGRGKIQNDSYLVDKVLEELADSGVDHTKISRFNHHECHAAAVYLGLASDPDKQYLVLTLDGGGDGECASVSIGTHGKLERLATTPSGHSIGNIYSNITHLMGFTPHEHEYKLMGMSPYVPAKYSDKAYSILKNYIALHSKNPMIFNRLTSEKTTQISLRLEEDLRLLRFDSIASGLQRFSEDLILEWVGHCIEKTGTRDVLLSGGVFMNIRVNQKIAELEQIHSVDVFPSCGDESNSIGCAFLLYSKMNDGRLFDFKSYCLGPKPSYDLEDAKSQFGDRCTFEVIENPNLLAAKLIAEGKIIARCSGPMEFGARALGNRSILADPMSFEMVDRVNFLIKQRDFWMPFAPAILKEDIGRYLRELPTLPDTLSPYMMFTFDTTKHHQEISACIHRRDKTARAQIISQEIYPDLHEILNHFKALTGRSAIMNTSFNLHGQPIVMGSIEAITILDNSNLDHVLVENTLVTKK